MILLLPACAQTSFFYQGAKVATFQGDMSRLHFNYSISPQGLTMTWDADTVSHSEPTRADTGRITAAASLVSAAVTAAVLVPK
jgi:hypothetical protein